MMEGKHCACDGQFHQAGQDEGEGRGEDTGKAGATRERCDVSTGVILRRLSSSSIESRSQEALSRSSGTEIVRRTSRFDAMEKPAGHVGLQHVDNSCSHSNNIMAIATMFMKPSKRCTRRDCVGYFCRSAYLMCVAGDGEDLETHGRWE